MGNVQQPCSSGVILAKTAVVECGNHGFSVTCCGYHEMFLTNASLRERFGVEEKYKAAVSRYFREAVDAGVIKPFYEDAARKLMKYVPFWA